MSKINLLSVFFLIVLFGCANTYKLEKKPVLSFTDSSYSSWSSGVKGGGSGFSVFLKMDESDTLDDKKIELKGVYFKDKYASLKLQGLGSYQAFFKNKSNSDRFVSDAQKDHKKEVSKEEKIPFVLNENEAVVSCLINGKQKYIKVVLTKKKTRGVPM
ncbi:hypothetical protein [Polaribacter sp. SA4-12]|uniref:hypothetical protein n=1 Tax=Polaribacter sp. SA4-12 TaxID=1312072 RepID=UPI000B56C65B|nr:hypothetical protein [Polaribacter sp. SA4-12]ARV16018.1 hypothetical protein BTO07_13060 [Polaribacter sp. SA4-12]